jgi:hypothetical protein
VAYDGDPNVDEISSSDLLGDYPALRYCPPSGDHRIRTSCLHGP